MIIGNRNFEKGVDTYVMGILNVTPDSFSDGGKYSTVEYALKHVEQMINEGVDIIDVGGESTRPGYTKVSDTDEIDRVVPVIKAIKNRYDIPVSIDTYKSEVALAAIEAGADMVNDIWGLKCDEKLADVIADKGVACCIMHNRKEAQYTDLVLDVISDLQESIDIAVKAGISKDKIMLDPGVGFAKTYEDNLTIINNLPRICDMGYPVLLGASRKSVIGLTLDLPVTQREEGTLVTTVWAVQSGCDFVRVHNIESNKRAIKMSKAIIGR